MSKKVISLFAIAISMALPIAVNAATKIEVEIEDFAYIPSSVFIQVGDTVEWKNRDDVAHTATSGQPGVPDGMWDSGLLSRDQRFSYVFVEAGTFDYYCKPHTWMTGMVTVEDRPDTTDTTTAGVEEPLISIERFELRINASSVSFSLPQAGFVKVSIHDVLGREAAVLAEGAYIPGTYDVDRPSLSSGLYFVRLVTSRGFTATARLVQIN
ncbi:cupredoxin domain-containing protein [candidate division WOR-3 bacterium]|nr:cupredoxin domain-containing protein [candidate division WOR-3 bacterium]